MLLAAASLLLSAPQAMGAPEDPSADREAALLHRRLDFSGIKQWNRATGSWQPLYVPPATVYVVNLWSIQCKPCVEEFPLLRNVLAGWRAKPEVQFLFIADPPGETSEGEAVAFWQRSTATATVPDAEPCRTTSENLRRILEDSSEPITLILDERFIVRQAFIGALGSRPLARSIERLLRITKDGAESGKRRR